MKKIISVIMALSMVFALASCTSEKASKKKDKETTTKKVEETTKKKNPSTDEGEKVTFEYDDDGDVLTTSPVNDEPVTDAPKPEAPAPEVPDTPVTPSMDIDKMINLINTETQKASQGNYNLKRVCSMGGMDFGSATALLNGIIKGVDENASLDTVVANFFDAGTTTATVKNGSASVDSAYLLKAMSLKLSDIDTYSIDGSYAFIALKNCNSPQFDSSNGLYHITNDFYTQAQVQESINSVLGSGVITVNNSPFNYNSIILEVWTSGSKITKVKIAYHLDVTLNLKISSVGITGKVPMDLAESYTNITY
jgi:hypothetical protein